MLPAPATATVVVFLLKLFSTCSHNYRVSAVAQVPSRFFYNNHNESGKQAALNGNTPEATSAAAEPTTNLKLLDGTSSIPLEFYEEMNNISDISEFIQRFVAEDSIGPQLGLRERVLNNVERASGKLATPAGCIPDNEIVELKPLDASQEPDIIYHPKCTRVKRCSGCCNSPLLSCQPTEKDILDLQVVKYRYVGPGNKIRAVGQEHVLVEQHTKCICGCRIKKENCNSYQVYDASQCRCICTNNDAREKCLAQEDKIWDYDACKCRCRDVQSCTTGTVFDENQCKCIESVIGGQSNTEAAFLLNRRRFILKAVPVETTNSTVYETSS